MEPIVKRPFMEDVVVEKGGKHQAVREKQAAYREDVGKSNG
ncbi:MAG: hypothetical protein P4L43_07925 [Syntrophobacteraceae bacterium]|nr:hypothetical protein [Syntrophobacteraceae bacterium]